MRKLEISNLEYSYDEHRVLENINVRILEGEFVMVVGKSGSGKTTLLKIIADLIKDYQGTFISDFKIGYMPQNNLLLNYMTVRKNIELPLELSGNAIEESEKTKIYKLFGLDLLLDKFPRDISGGEQSRAALLRSYFMSQDLILLDEPFSALDWETKEELLSWLKTLKDELKLTLILVTHDLEDAKYADRIFSIENQTVSEYSNADFQKRINLLK